MFARILRSLIAFGGVFVAYQAYALLVAPALEPSVKAKHATASTAEQRNAASNGVSRFQRQLAHYFPADHWSLTGLPKVIKSGQVMLVIENYDKNDRGEVNFTKCAAVLFTSPTRVGEAPPDDAIVFEAPGGAQLQFDENFQPSRGRIGKITSGVFPGPITIRSRMRDPGPEDDLLIVTRDVRMNESMIFTPHDVSIRHGRNTGRGRRMEIKLLAEDHARSSAGGLRISGVESIEIFEQVRLELRMGRLNPLTEPQSVQITNPFARPYRLTAFNEGDDAAAWGDAPATRATPGPILRQPSVYSQGPAVASAPGPSFLQEEPPVEVTCAGSFQMDLTDFVATFRDRVHARQLNLDGQFDQLTCRELRLFFGQGEDRQAVAIDPRLEPELSKRQRNALSNLRPRRFEAIGDPVKVNSPSRNAEARGQHLTYDFRERQLTLDGGKAMIARAGSFVEAPIIRYEHPAVGAAAAIGRMWVAGPGRLKATGSDADVNAGGPRGLEARWGKAPGVQFPVILAPDERGQPLLTVKGRPQMAAQGLGSLTAERVTMAFAQVLADGPEGPALELGGDGKALLPQRIDADGRVEVESPRLAAATERLTVRILPQQAGPVGAASTAGGGAADRLGSSSLTRPSSGPAYRLTAREAQLDVTLAGARAEPTTLVCSGAVDFRERNPRQGEQPLSVRGDRLQVDGLENDALLLTVHGQSAPATLAARGVTLRAADVHLDQKKNRMWADGPGDAHLQTNRDLMGQSTNAATDLHLRWRGGWVFDGQRIRIRDDVFGEGPHDWVRAGEMIATLSRPIRFDDMSGSDGLAIEVDQIDCHGGVTIDHRSIDELGQRSQERAQLASLSINQRTGSIAGTGPGWVRSVHLSEGGNPLANLAGPADAAAPQPAAGARLRLLRVHFQQGLAGSFKERQRRLNFFGRVRSIYGPVMAWQQDLSVDPHGPLPPDTATLACDELQVNEDPMGWATRPRTAPANAGGGLDARLGPIELIAKRNVRLEGAADDGGSFTAQAARASYSQMKELFELMGDGAGDATLWVRSPPKTGQPSSGVLEHSAGRVSYWRRTGVVQTDINSTRYTPNATRPGSRTR